MRWYPHRIPRIITTFFPSLDWEGDQQSVHLTFDDGPHPTITPYVLDLLKQHQQKATFFLIGENALRYPAVIDQILAEGHTIGNHTQRHLQYHKHPLTKYLKDIEICDLHIPKTNLFRPPFGSIGFRGIRALKNRRIIMWTLLSGDFDPEVDLNHALKQLKTVKPKDIIVFHDSEKALPQLKELLPPLLEHMGAKQLKSTSL